MPEKRMTAEPPVTVDDLVLGLLYAEPDRPVKGGLMMMKLLFLIGKEIEPELDQLLSFFPKDFGPYSQKVASSLNRLEQTSLVSSRKSAAESGDLERTDFKLTSLGRERARVAFDRLRPETRAKVQQLRRGAEELGYSGILRYVYSKYPEYADSSKIREDYQVDY